MEFLQQLVQLAQQITAFLGEFEASGILHLVSDFLGKADATSIGELIQGIFGIAAL